MKLLSFVTSEGTPGVGALTQAGIADLSTLVPGRTGLSPMRTLLTQTDHAEILGAATDAPVLDPESVILQPPVPDPSKIVAAPVNYLDHKEEMSQAVHISSLGVFLKAPSSLTPPSGTVRLPYHDRRFDQEGELAVVIGRTASHVPEDRAADHIFGYTCLLDMTMRGGEDRSTRKSFDTFTPMGPYLVTPDEVGPVDDLELRCWVNGRLRQRAALKDLIWNVPRLIAYISSVMELHPGDVIATGTPAGVGEVHDGDHIAVEITRVGRLEVGVSSTGAVSSPTLGANRGPKPPAEVTPVR
ncbi:2-keto-4-pentenoate hydratase/2-oxohepta-3-ene-1,7-dioic acid hydratase in catechol pathway [Amycolatopsis thermoflava]|uniref:2-keto-4-pentenoate hydratase/2-oxohepta-3-ene-1,7-dioic acid hydratase in catechol pathway n=2 Tax=Amycolatopsis thermoflava TaxID=84480 RepID=A0A3N2H5T9_9PSEU|nr:2-keto-4-pentenoate hydratase/2-oxohepta-3-ene-1,7-dioic acid hydratase in catechol pathway [Amycolatopsis thermoflava]